MPSVFLLAWLVAAAPVAEGDECVLTSALEARPEGAKRAVRVPEGARVRVVRPGKKRTVISAGGKLYRTKASDLAELCQRIEKGGVSIAGRAPAEILALAESASDELRYEEVVPLAGAVLDAQDATLPQRLMAYQLLGSAHAVMGDALQAQRAFRFLLRANPDLELPEDTTPKVLTVFRFVQVEERQVAAQLRAVERERMIKEIELSGYEELREVKGGEPLAFDLGVKDPRGVIGGVEIAFKKRGQGAFSTLALSRGDAGRWTGALPAGFTASAEGFSLHYLIRTLDSGGTPLRVVGTEEAPLTVEVSPGSLPGGEATETVWFWTAVGAATLAAVATVGVGVGAYAAAQPPGERVVRVR